MKIQLSALLLLTTAACATAPLSPDLPPPPAASAAEAPAAPVADPLAEDQRLTTFLDAAFEAQVARSPQALTSLGRKDRYNELNSYTDANAAEGLALAQKQLADMKAQFDPARLSPAGRLSYRLFESQVQREVENFRWRRHGFIASTNGSPAGSLPVFLINNHKIDSVSDAEAYIARLQAVERVMNEITANMRAQSAAGIVPSTFNFAPVRRDAERVLAGAPFASGADTPVYADFKSKVGKLSITQTEKDRLIAAAREALTGPYQRGYRTFLATWSETEKQAKGNRGAWGLPDGQSFYANRLRNSTTTTMGAEQIHQLGLAQVAAIHARMEVIKAQVGFRGTLRQFFDELRTNPKYRYPDTDAGRAAYIKDAEAFVAQVMAKSPEWFRRLPKAPLEVRAVEKWREGTASIAFYNSPSEDGTRPGIYYSNLANMADVSKPQLEARSYHEGAPGHHFQIALAQELPNIPKFRRFGGYGAYAEGWGLYAEGLGKEMGFYQDPISEFGMLSTQVWRAVRLVVDTGIHDKRWTREQAIDYFMANAPLSRADAVREVERYFNNPGQATSYMVGQLKILDLREKAKRELGDRFDIRDFHAAVLENGSLPLDVLEEQVNAYIAAKRG